MTERLRLVQDVTALGIAGSALNQLSLTVGVNVQELFDDGFIRVGLSLGGGYGKQNAYAIGRFNAQRALIPGSKPLHEETNFIVFYPELTAMYKVHDHFLLGIIGDSQFIGFEKPIATSFGLAFESEGLDFGIRVSLGASLLRSVSPDFEPPYRNVAGIKIGLFEVLAHEKQEEAAIAALAI